MGGPRICFCSIPRRGFERELKRKAEQRDDTFQVKAKKPNATASEATPANAISMPLADVQLKRTEATLQSIEEHLSKAHKASGLLDDASNGAKAFVPDTAPRT